MSKTASPGKGTTSSGRLKQPPAPELVASAYRWEVGLAPYLWEGMGLSDLAHMLMLVETGIVPSEPGRRLLALLLQLQAFSYDHIALTPERGDVYTNREHWLVEQDADAAGWFSTGRARREATTVAYHLAVRKRLLHLAEALSAYLNALCDQAEAHLQTVMPDYTYLQHAHPTTLAHYLLGFAYPALRDLERLQAALQRVNRSPAGGGSTNGSRLPLDRQRLAQLLGFDDVLPHPRDAMWQADGPIEVAAAVVALTVQVDRLAEDLQLWCTEEFGLIELADEHARTSIIMPQKKNPYALAYIRGVSGQVMGKLTAMAVTGRTPSGQVDNRIFAYGEVPATLDLALEAVRLMAGVVASITVNTVAMAQRATEGYTYGTDLAEVLVQEHGLDFRTAHRLVGAAVRLAHEQGAPTMTPAIIDLGAQEVMGQPLKIRPALLQDEMTPFPLVAARQGVGGASPASTARMLEEVRAATASAETWRVETAARIAGAEQGLVALAEMQAVDALPKTQDS